MSGLPELPEPQKECWIGHQLFNADQMHAYAQAIEAQANKDEIEHLDTWLRMAYEPVNRVCCGRPGPECCGDPQPVWETYAAIFESMGKRYAALTAAAAPADEVAGGG